MEKMIEALARQGEVLELELKIMQYDFDLYKRIKHIFDERNEYHKGVIYGYNKNSNSNSN